MAYLFGTIAGILLMLTVAGILSATQLIAIGIGGIIGSILIAPMWAARRNIHDKH
ncbi:MAG: hypothetical protein L0I88_01320 [Alkalibacterium sp.]|nr:hypothetical protein [Alkalibacterium sp.]